MAAKIIVQKTTSNFCCKCSGVRDICKTLLYHISILSHRDQPFWLSSLSVVSQRLYTDNKCDHWEVTLNICNNFWVICLKTLQFHMFFYIAKIFANHFACGRRQLPLILQKKELQTSLYLQGTNMVGLGNVIGGAHTHILIQITYTISISQLRLWKTTPSCPPESIYLPCMLSDTSLLPCLSYLFVFSLQSGVECQLQSCPAPYH